MFKYGGVFFLKSGPYSDAVAPVVAGKPPDNIFGWLYAETGGRYGD
ncbi:MAG TPA: hypothetical protein VJ550_10445 [Geomonas sp.]|nr:hypothetical protein [Geomonas sp.]